MADKPVVLVTGGSGFLGHNLCAHLLATGWSVRNLDLAPFAYPGIGPVDSRRGDIRDEATVRAAMQGATAVVHCAAALPRDAPELIRTTNIEGTGVVATCAEHLGVKRLVFISSTAVYGVPDHHPLSEDAPLKGLGPYGDAKIAAEARCLAGQGPMVVSVIRPKSFIGKGRLGLFDVVFDWIRSGKHVPIIGSGRNRYQLLDVADLCAAIELCLTAPPAQVAGVFNVGAEEFTTLRQDLQHVLDHAGFGKRVIPLPAAPLIAVLRVLESLRLSPLYAWVYETAGKDSYVSIERFKAQTGWRPKVSNKAALLACYQDYVTAVERGAVQFGSGHRARWKQGALGVAKLFF